jgi:Protein of unknown function (DUF1549)/Protein of unknown function (DUF1553)
MPTFALLLLIAVDSPSQEIDALLAKEQSAQSVHPVEVCSDDTFLRRITLDLAGRIPTRAELIAFRGSPDRPAKISELLAGDEFARFWSEIWTASLVGYNTRPFGTSREPLRQWLEQGLRDAMPYDELVRQLISAEGDSAFDGPVNFLLRHREEPVVKVSRMFLGIRLGCARCHDHPFDRWKRDDFDAFGRFFEGMEIQEVSERNLRLFTVPREAERDDRPRFLSSARPTTSRWRDELALMLTSCKPFARNYANRMWYHFLGQGIVQPPDDFSANAPIAPALLDFLTDFARQTNFDTTSMIEAICNSQAYQRCSGHADADAASHRLFASFVPKPMVPEQLLKSLSTVFQRETPRVDELPLLLREVDNSLDVDFSRTWQYRDNVQTVMRRLVRDLPVGPASITSLYETILSRSPTASERALCRGRPTSQVVFALIHSNEFRFVH